MESGLAPPDWLGNPVKSMVSMTTTSRRGYTFLMHLAPRHHSESDRTVRQIRPDRNPDATRDVASQAG